MSVIASVPSSGRPAGARRRGSRLGYRVGGGLVAAACIGAAAALLAQAATRRLYLDVPRAAAPPGWLGTDAAGPAGNSVVVSACHGDRRYDVPGERGRAGTAIASLRAAVAGDSDIGATPGDGAGGTAATGGGVLWYAVAHIAGAAAVVLARAGPGTALIIITAVCRSRRAARRDTPMTAGRTFRGRWPRRGRMARSELEVSGDDGQGYRCSPAAAT